MINGRIRDARADRIVIKNATSVTLRFVLIDQIYTYMGCLFDYLPSAAITTDPFDFWLILAVAFK